MVKDAQVRVLRRKLMEGKTQESAAAGVGSCGQINLRSSAPARVPVLMTTKLIVSVLAPSILKCS